MTFYFFFPTVNTKKTYHQQEGGVEWNCSMSGTSQDFLTDPQQGPSLDPVASGARASAGRSQRDISFLPAVCSPNCPSQFQHISSSCWTLRPTSVPPDTPNENSVEATLKTDESCVQSTLAHVHHYELGHWTKEDLEPCRAPSGLLYTSEPRTASTPGEKDFFFK